MMTSSSYDTVYATPLDDVGHFRFDAKVADVFPDMIRRSIPGYSTILDRLGHLTRTFCQNKANYYDLGCSLGAATLVMRRNMMANDGHIFAVDNSKAMLERCQKHVETFKFSTPVTYLLDDICDVTIKNAAIVVLNFTLQFIKQSARQHIIDRIYQGLKPGGLLFLSEKIRYDDPVIDKLLIDCHHDFKKSNGYSELEISQKRSALENVLLPDTDKTHFRRFQTAGFSHFATWYQQLNFISMIAVK